MKKYLIGIITGLAGAVINIVFLLFTPKLDTTIYISTGITWLVIGLLISACDFKINGIVKGIIVALLVSASSLVYTISSTLSGALWTIVNTVIVGAIIGFVIEKTQIKSEKK
ncbi:hypothetical protein [Bacillus sp. JJ722]|uniref:hypothetical protein n=1 Tax=Bacillus sp. JJ722 TaxID=3122973 RepID=UPI002FFEB9ED